MDTDMEPVLPVKAIAFDCFGTLAQIQAPSQAYRNLIKLMPTHFQPPARRAVMANAWTFPETIQQLGVCLPEDDLEGQLRMLQDELASIALFPETLTVLRELRQRGYKLALCSNLALPFAAPIEALLGPLLDVKIWSFEVQCIKPEGAIYQKLCEALALPAEDVLMVGDSLASDYTGARAAGLHARHLTRDTPHQRMGRTRIRSLDDVLRLVK